MINYDIDIFKDEKSDEVFCNSKRIYVDITLWNIFIKRYLMLQTY